MLGRLANKADVRSASVLSFLLKNCDFAHTVNEA